MYKSGFGLVGILVAVGAVIVLGAGSFLIIGQQQDRKVVLKEKQSDVVNDVTKETGVQSEESEVVSEETTVEQKSEVVPNLLELLPTIKSEVVAWNFTPRLKDIPTSETCEEYFYIDSRFSECPDDNVEDWEEFNNTSFSYRLLHPSGNPFKPASNCFAEEDASVCSNVNVYSLISINIFEPYWLESYPEFGLPLDEYVKKVHEMNEPESEEERRTELRNVKFADTEAYTFTMLGSYDLPTGGRLYEEPTTFVFVKIGELLYEISFPTLNDSSTAILNSFNFIDDSGCDKYTNEEFGFEICSPLDVKF